MSLWDFLGEDHLSSQSFALFSLYRPTTTTTTTTANSQSQTLDQSNQSVVYRAANYLWDIR